MAMSAPQNSIRSMPFRSERFTSASSVLASSATLIVAALISCDRAPTAAHDATEAARGEQSAAESANSSQPATDAASAATDPAQSPPQATRPAQPNVILLVLDTLRADRLGCYGCERPTSPRIDAFAASATRYARCEATAPWTLPTHASIFTGRFPIEHGAVSFLPEKREPRNAYPLSRNETTLAEVLRDAGYETQAFVANVGYAGRWTGLDQGFDGYFVQMLYGDQLNERITAWLKNRSEPDRPFLLFVNYMDTHRPYNLETPAPFLDAPAEPKNQLIDELARTVLPGKRDAPPALRQRVLDQYDTAVHNLDRAIGAMLDAFAERGMLENTVIVITADHGEYIGEHRLAKHSKDVYEPALWVPLIVHMPGQTQGDVVNDRISSAAIANLITHGFGPGGLRDTLLQQFPFGPDQPLILADNHYSRTKDLFRKPWAQRFKRVRTALYMGQHKYIRSSDGANELYHLTKDAGELRNLLAKQPDLGDELAAALEAFETRLARPRAQSQPSQNLSDEQLRQMATLGYVDADAADSNDGKPDE